MRKNQISNEFYKELYKREKEKYINLFKEMLNFLKLKYEQEDFYYLISLVEYNYPYYIDTLMHLENLMNDPEESYISLLNSMEKIYNKISKNYKNHDENMKKYEEEKNQYEFGDMEDDDEF